jgi:quercetin dioxygenase-like cupin family protein
MQATAPADAVGTETARPGHTPPAGEWYAGSLVRWHVVSEQTGGSFALGEVLVRSGGEPPLHIHAREDETFYVLEGEVTFRRGNELIEARPGDTVLMPRGVQHGFAIGSETARFVFALTPGGLEQAFRALSEPAPVDALPPAPSGPPPPEAIEVMTAVFADHGVEFTGPPLSALL